MPKITITIDKKGRAVIQAEGFSGPACTNVTKNLEAALGGATSQEVTRDYYEPDQEIEQDVHRG